MLLNGQTVLYGGSFNPPHIAHQMTCLYLLEGLAADTVWLLPAFRHPFGKPLASFEERTAMCSLLAAPFGGRVEVSLAEAEPQTSGRTYDTLVRLKEVYPERRFALAVGADILSDAPRWYRWDEIQAMVNVVVIGRSGHPSGAELDLPAVSSTEIRRRLGVGQTITGLVPAKVTEYIRERGLYRMQGDGPCGASQEGR